VVDEGTAAVAREGMAVAAVGWAREAKAAAATATADYEAGGVEATVSVVVARMTWSTAYSRTTPGTPRHPHHGRFCRSSTTGPISHPGLSRIPCSSIMQPQHVATKSEGSWCRATDPYENARERQRVRAWVSYVVMERVRCMVPLPHAAPAR
jgi:hypothetical protein